MGDQRRRQNLGPLTEGKRSAVAGVNDSPVDCQSCDGIARRRLSAQPTGGVFYRRSNTPSVMLTHDSSPTGGAKGFLCGILVYKNALWLLTNVLVLWYNILNQIKPLKRR